MDGHFVAETLSGVSEDVLYETGRGGVFSSGYLYDDPFVEYLEPRETVLALLWSDRTPPEHEGAGSLSFELGSYGAVAALTPTRVLVVGGSAGGNQTVELQLERILDVASGSEGRIRSQQWLALETDEATLKIFDRTDLDITAVQRRVAEAAVDARHRVVETHLAEATTQREERDVAGASTSVDAATNAREQLEQFAATHGVSLPEGQRELEQRINQLREQFEFDELLEQADAAEAEGSIATAIDVYRELQEIHDSAGGWTSQLDPETHIWRLEIKKAQTEVEASIDNARSAAEVTEQYGHYRTAVYALDEYDSVLAERRFEEREADDDTNCGLCGAFGADSEILAGDLIWRTDKQRQSDVVRVCDRCSSLDQRNGWWGADQITAIRGELATRLAKRYPDVEWGTGPAPDPEQPPHPAELRLELSQGHDSAVAGLLMAVQRVASNLGRPPSRSEFTSDSGYDLESIIGVFGSWGAALETTDVDCRSALLAEIRNLAERTRLIPTPTEVLQNSRYDSSVWGAAFSNIDSAIVAAGFEPIETPLKDWQRRLRTLVKESSTVPLRHRAAEEGVNVSELVEQLRSWRQVLKHAGVLEDAIGLKIDLAADIEGLAETLGHTPSQTEYLEYGSYESWEVRKAFGSFEDAIAALNLSERDVTTIDEPIDEPPDAGSSIPSHTSLLQKINWLQQRHGTQKAKDRFTELNSFDAEHFELQFGSVDEAFEVLEQLNTTETEDASSLTTSNNTDSKSESSTSSDKRAELITTLQALYEDLDRVPKANDLGDTQYSIHDYVAEFGDFDSAFSAAEIDKEGFLLSDIERVAEELGRKPSSGDMNDHGVYTGGTYSSYFGSWSAALEAASLSDFGTASDQNKNESKAREVESAPSEESTGTRPLPDPSVSKEELLSEIRRARIDTGDWPVKTEITNSGEYPVSSYRAAFGSVDDAIAEAKRAWREELLSMLRDLWKERGEEPTKAALLMNTEYRIQYYRDAFGSWEEAVAMARPDPTAATQHNDDLGGEDRTPVSAESQGRAPEQLDEQQRTLSEEFVRLWEEQGEQPNKAAVAVHTDYRLSEFKSAFGDWETVVSTIKQVGMAPTSSAEQTSDGSARNTGSTSPNGSGRPSREALINELQWIDETVDGPLLGSHAQSLGEFAVQNYSKEFGSFDAALEAAGIDRGEQLIAEIQRVADQLGQIPSRTKMNDHGRVSTTTVANHFGNWRTAIEKIDPPGKESTEAAQERDGEKDGADPEPSPLVDNLMRDLDLD